MSPTAGFQPDEWWRAAPKRSARPLGLRRALRALRGWWARERYRPERRYMRG